MMENGRPKLLIYTFIALLSACAFLSLEVWKDKSLLQTKQIYIQVFDGVLGIPTDYVLFEKGRKISTFDDIAFIRDDGSKVVISHSLQKKQDLLKYLKSGSDVKKKCGLNVYEVPNDKITVFADNFDLVMFYAVDHQIIDHALADLCLTNANK